MIACKQVSETARASHPTVFEQPLKKLFNTLVVLDCKPLRAGAFFSVPAIIAFLHLICIAGVA
jgi:hypothetical protein